ncbi:MAG: hypothetical protein RIB65_13880 [Ilumatobacter fluminis]|uniref:hypothetical protein n=1 Tax=Ilumatobacter fluminis TaxID=467091 RepID=UPI0032EF9C60
MPESQATDASTTLPPPPGVVTEQVRLVEAPRDGELATGWRVVTACLWISVIVAFAAVWSTSVQLGLSTWWLGPRADPRSPIIRLAPFVAPLLMTIATFNNMRRLAWYGMGASLVTAVFGIVDLGRAPRLAAVELLVAGLAFAVSAASLTGTYRPVDVGAGDGSAESADDTVR